VSAQKGRAWDSLLDALNARKIVQDIKDANERLENVCARLFLKKSALHSGLWP
jgi:hypothetical protein